jgi:2-phosphosulfolactate phosphatase
MTDIKKISVCFTPDQFEKYGDGTSTVVIVDLLRATSVISTAFSCGIEAIIPVQTIEQALAYKDKEGYILAAERNTEPVEGFEYGNSPYHYINTGIEGKTLVLTTTNGTQAIHLAKKHKVITASFVNIDAVAKYLIEESNNVIILCSGWKNLFNLEDPIFAGALSNLLLNSGNYKSNCDALLTAQQLYLNAKDDIFLFLNNSSYRKRNNSEQVIKDTKFCLNPTIKSNIVPIFNDGKLIRA